MFFSTSKRKSRNSKKGKNKNLGNFHENLVFIGITILGVLIIAQCFRWMVLHRPRLQALAQSQYQETQRHASTRGVIYAADGSILATDQPAWDVYASLSSLPLEREAFFKEKDKYIAEVGALLNLEQAFLEDKLTEDFRFVPLAINIDTELKKALESKKIFEEKPTGFGLYFEKTEKRIYPNGELAAHVLGFMGRDGEGKDMGLYGIEGYYHTDITGNTGVTYEEIDAEGNVILTSEYKPILPRDGKDITLTIRPGIQRKVETKLAENVKEFRAKSGTAIVMDPRTGEIIALANYPTYNGNEYWKTQEPWIFKNKAVADAYEPGSVFKPLTVAIGLETETISKDTLCDDTTGKFTLYEGRPDEKTIYTWDRLPDGYITPREYLQYSNNPCIAKTALDVGHEDYYPKMQEFGIGEFVGTGLQDETGTYLMPFENWTEIDVAVASFGQGLSTTPLQILSANSAIANDGKRMQPYIIKSIETNDEVIEVKPQIASTPISEETADTVADMMRSVPLYGDGSDSFSEIIKEYDIAGKTGTAQIAKSNEVGYHADRVNTTFIGFAPADEPTMIMLVRLEEPENANFSSYNVVPTWVDIFEEIALDLEVPRRK